MTLKRTTQQISHPVSPTHIMKRYTGMGLIAALMLCTTFGAWAHTTALQMHDAWIRGSVPGQKNGAAYVQIHNQNTHPMTLEGVTTDRAERVELHTVDRDSGVARMREVGSIDIAANQTVSLAPGGYHLMLMGLKTPFQPGETVTLMLNFKGYDPMPVTFKVMPPTHQPSGSPAAVSHGSSHHGHGMAH